MYYYGYNGGFGQTPYYQNSYPNNTGFVGYTTCSNYGSGAALWIVLFVLLVIIIGAGFTVGGNNSGPGPIPR